MSFQDRQNFPNCRVCPYVQYIHWNICFPCASESITSIIDPCPICSQERRGAECHNWLCNTPDEERHISSIAAVALHSGDLATVIKRYKYGDKKAWAMIFARLLVGYLEWNLRPNDVDLIVANPPNPGKDHTTRVIKFAALHDLQRRWPFDSIDPPAMSKQIETPKSANNPFCIKQDAAIRHAAELKLLRPDRIKGKRIIVYDDVCTTGLQLNCVAEKLIEWGAQSVSGLVLARQPWSEG